MGIDYDEYELIIKRKVPIFQDNLLFCNQDADCVIKYNVGPECHAGCVNKEAQVNQSCNQQWEQFQLGTYCICQNQKCQTIEPDSL